jgi:hypothetical protein
VPIRFRINRDIRIQPQGLLGCFLTLLGVGALAAVAMILLLPMLGIALGIGLGLVLIGMAVLAYYRVRAWFSRLRGRGGEGGKYDVQVLDMRDVPPDDEDGTDDDAGEEGDGGIGGDDNAGGPGQPRQRQNVEVRRRPPA